MAKRLSNERSASPPGLPIYCRNLRASLWINRIAIKPTLASNHTGRAREGWARSVSALSECDSPVIDRMREPLLSQSSGRRSDSQSVGVPIQRSPFHKEIRSDGPSVPSRRAVCAFDGSELLGSVLASRATSTIGRQNTQKIVGQPFTS